MLDCICPQSEGSIVYRTPITVGDEICGISGQNVFLTFEMIHIYTKTIPLSYE
jgi:hypothetical protein